MTSQFPPRSMADWKKLASNTFRFDFCQTGDIPPWPAGRRPEFDWRRQLPFSNPAPDGRFGTVEIGGNVCRAEQAQVGLYSHRSALVCGCIATRCPVSGRSTLRKGHLAARMPGIAIGSRKGAKLEVQDRVGYRPKRGHGLLKRIGLMVNPIEDHGRLPMPTNCSFPKQNRPIAA